MTATTSDRLAAAREGVDAVLTALLDDAAKGVPDRLAAAMRYAALAGGKRLRPFFVLESAAMFDAPREGLARVAAAIECIHSYSLVHDDLPAMDDDDLRRGQPTVHRAFDEATAILAGDALLTLAFEVLADPATHPDAGVRVALVAGLARHAGAAGMVGGQELDLAAEREPPGAEGIGRLQRMKTGALFGFACEAGACHAGADDAGIAALAAFGVGYGAAFQMADDLIDATGDTASAGKRTGKDADRGKATFVALDGVDGARRRLEEAVDDAVRHLAPFGDRADILIAAARSLVA